MNFIAGSCCIMISTNKKLYKKTSIIFAYMGYTRILHTILLVLSIIHFIVSSSTSYAWLASHGISGTTSSSGLSASTRINCFVEQDK